MFSLGITRSFTLPYFFQNALIFWTDTSYTSLIIVHLILDVDGDGPLYPDGGDEDLDGAVAPHQRHHRRLHERQVRQRRGRQQERLGRLGPLRERCKRQGISVSEATNSRMSRPKSMSIRISPRKLGLLGGLISGRGFLAREAQLSRQKPNSFA